MKHFFEKYKSPIDSKLNNFEKYVRRQALVDYNIFNELNDLIREYDQDRILNQFEKIALIEGDAVETIPNFVDENKHLIVALLFLDFDLYEPTKIALDFLLNRIPKGAIVAFDELNNKYWPGETVVSFEKYISVSGNLQCRKIGK